MKHHWYTEVSYEENDVRSQKYLAQDEGVLMIGDKAFGLEKKYKYVYNLRNIDQNRLKCLSCILIYSFKKIWKKFPTIDSRALLFSTGNFKEVATTTVK